MTAAAGLDRLRQLAAAGDSAAFWELYRELSARYGDAWAAGIEPTPRDDTASKAEGDRAEMERRKREQERENARQGKKPPRDKGPRR